MNESNCIPSNLMIQVEKRKYSVRKGDQRGRLKERDKGIRIKKNFVFSEKVRMFQ